MENEVNLMTFPKLENDIILKYINMRKVARRNWNIVAYSFTYCLSYSSCHFLMHERLKNKWMILMSFVSCYLFSGYFETKMVSKFNSHHYNNFKIFCLKYKIVDEYF